MSRAVPAIEPTEVQAGNTLEWTKSLDDFPASAWTLTYVVRSPTVIPQDSSPFSSITATASGDDFAVTITAVTTAAWPAGTYWLLGYVSTVAGQRFEIYRGKLSILPDIQAATSFDGRTYWERLLDKIRDVIEQGVIRDTIRYTWNGVDVQIVTMEDALKAEAWIASKVAQEKSSTKQRKILTRFVSAR